ncbi:hypothetical protein TNCV_1006791 [Trichonephila clavipes]|nr:hypothetical protein TNCV_1006791 [Trichonephila clavipes]
MHYGAAAHFPILGRPISLLSIPEGGLDVVYLLFVCIRDAGSLGAHDTDCRLFRWRCQNSGLCQQLIELERVRVKGLREGRFSSRGILQTLGWDVETVHDNWEQWSSDGYAHRYDLLQDNDHPQTTVLAQRALKNIDMLPWPTRSSDLSPIDLVRDINGRKLQNHPHLALTVPVLMQQVQQT